ncbi:hypothetical protein OH77DRAFT_103336 [Trametes cingulata]|nr:hypothetical protein OH77DRAFT_103336 [Trametes cingulata]
MALAPLPARSGRSPPTAQLTFPRRGRPLLGTNRWAPPRIGPRLWHAPLGDVHSGSRSGARRVQEGRCSLSTYLLACLLSSDRCRMRDMAADALLEPC